MTTSPAAVRDRTAGRGGTAWLLAALGPQAFRQALDATRAGGRMMVFSATAPGENVELDLGALCSSEKQILTSYSASVDVQELAAQPGVRARGPRARADHAPPAAQRGRARVELAAPRPRAC